MLHSLRFIFLCCCSIENRELKGYEVINKQNVVLANEIKFLWAFTKEGDKLLFFKKINLRFF